MGSATANLVLFIPRCVDTRTFYHAVLLIRRHVAANVLIRIAYFGNFFKCTLLECHQCLVLHILLFVVRKLAVQFQVIPIESQRKMYTFVRRTLCRISIVDKVHIFWTCAEAVVNKSGGTWTASLVQLTFQINGNVVDLRVIKQVLSRYALSIRIIYVLHAKIALGFGNTMDRIAEVQ